MSVISSYMLVLLLDMYFHTQDQARLLYRTLFEGHVCLETHSGDVFGSNWESMLNSGWLAAFNLHPLPSHLPKFTQKFRHMRDPILNTYHCRCPSQASLG